MQVLLNVRLSLLVSFLVSDDPHRAKLTSVVFLGLDPRVALVVKHALRYAHHQVLPEIVYVLRVLCRNLNSDRIVSVRFVFEHRHDVVLHDAVPRLLRDERGLFQVLKVVHEFVDRVELKYFFEQVSVLWVSRHLARICAEAQLPIIL